jgi:hypothetical protein
LQVEVRRVAVHNRAEEVEVRVDLHGQTRFDERIDVGFGPERNVRRIRRLARRVAEFRRLDQEHVPQRVELAVASPGHGIEHVVVVVGWIVPVPVVVAGIALRQVGPQVFISRVDDLIEVRRRMFELLGFDALRSR